MDQRRWLGFIAITSVIYILFYLVYLVPYQKKAEEYRKVHPELFARPGGGATSETLTAATSPTLVSLRPSAEATSATTAEQGLTSATAELKPATIVVQTKLYRVVLTSRGGRPTSWRYFDFMPGKAEPEVIEMIPQHPDSPDRELPLEVILKESNRIEYPTFNTSVYEYQVASKDGDSTEVVFTSPEIQKLQLVKSYQFRPDAHVTRLRVVVRNLGEKAPCQVDDDGRGLGVAWGPGVGQFQPRDPRVGSGVINVIYDTPGGVRYAAPAKPAAEDDERGRRAEYYRGDVGWAGVTDKFFMASVIPNRFKGVAVQFLVRRKNVISKEATGGDEAFHSPPFTIVVYGDKFAVKPRHEADLDYDVFVGPKRPALLEEVSKQTQSHLDHVLFYDSWFRWMRLIKLGLMYSLAFLYSKIHNYGAAIVILTILIRAVMHPIAHKGMKMQAKSMAEMQKIKPLLDEVNRKYKSDPTRKNQEVMKLYKEHGISPLAPLRGCLPMLIQLPIFVALYTLFNQSIDLRGATFLWIRDLAAPDTLVDLTRYGLDFRVPLIGHIAGINLLPILMGVSQYFISKLTPTPSRDPQQKQMMMMLTFMFPVMFYNLPSGLFLYWLINNVWQTTHQIITNRSIAKPPESGAAVAKA